MNRITLAGRMGDAARVHTFGNGDRVAYFSLATSRRRRLSDGQFQETPDWHRIRVYGPAEGGAVARITASVFAKGAFVCINGQLTYQESERNGERIRTAYIEVRGTQDIEFVTSPQRVSAPDAKPDEADPLPPVPEMTEEDMLGLGPENF